MIKIITSDIDETLVDSNKKVPQRNIDNIKKAKEMGLIVMLATGRGPYELHDIPKEAGVIDKDRFIICCNGAVIVRADDRKIVDSQTLDFKYVKRIFDFCYEKKLEFFIYTVDKKYGINLDNNEKVRSYTNDSYVVEIKDSNINFLKDELILKALIKNTDMAYLNSLEIDIAEITDYSLEIAYSSNMFMEINAKGVDKGIALKKVCDYYGIDISEALAIGDNYNDVAMIETAGIGVAVRNAHLQVKERADYVTKATNEEGAVGEAIEKFVLNK